MTAHGLIIGNCHAAALRLAWRQHSTDWPDLSLDFVAVQGDGISDLAVDDLTLSSPTDAVRANLTDLNGQDRFDLSPYDFIALCGGTPSSYHAVHLYQTARWPGLPSVAADPSPLTLLSTLCFEHALAGVIGQAPVCPILVL